MAAKDRRRFMRQADIKSAFFIKVGIARLEKRSKAISDKENGSPHTMRQAMRSCSICCRIWRCGLYDLQLSRQVLAQRATMPHGE